MPVFRSRHQAELLAQLLLHPETEYTLTELKASLDKVCYSDKKEEENPDEKEGKGVPLTTVQTEVTRLVKAGLIRDRKQGRNRLVSSNPANPATAPLTQLVMMSFGPAPVIGEEFAIDNVEQVIIFGSWAARFGNKTGPPPHDIDVLVVGTASELAVYEAADRAQARIGIEVNPVRATPAQWADPGDWTLLIEIQKRPHVVVYSRDEAVA